MNTAWRRRDIWDPILRNWLIVWENIQWSVDELIRNETFTYM